MERARSLFAFSIISTFILTLAGCSTPTNTTSSTPVTPSQPWTGTTIYVGGSVVLAFQSGASGNPSPSNTINLPEDISVPSGIHLFGEADYVAVDPSGNIYTVSNANGLLEFAAGATGSATPIRSIPPEDFENNYVTTIVDPTGLVTDSSGNVYVADEYDGIAVFNPTANGIVAPTRHIYGNLTQFYYPWGIAVDGSGYLYVANGGPTSGQVLVFAPNANGNVAPTRVLNVTASIIAADAAGDLYAGTYDANQDPQISVYAPGASGSATPTRLISGSATGLAGIYGIAVDSIGNIYVSVWATPNTIGTFPTILQFAPSANGNVAPTNSFTPTAWTPVIASLAVH